MKTPSCTALIAAVLAPCAFAQTATPSLATETPQLSTVVIKATPGADQARQELEAEQALTPGAVTLVDGESLRQRSVISLADMLRYVPGLWAASGSTGDSSFLSSRGSNLDATNYDGNGIKLLQDGLPVTAADGNNHNRQIDPLSARHAVVARGANALTYGASTLGGAIDFTTPTARDGAPNELSLNLGSHGHRQAGVTLGGIAGNVDGLLTAETRRYDGFRMHHRQERSSLSANVGWQLANNLQTRFYANNIDNQQQLPGALTRQQWLDDPEQAEAAAVAGNYRLNVKSWRLANKTVWDIDADSKLTVGLSLENQQLYHPIVYAPPFFSLLIDTEQRTLGSTVRYQRRIGAHDVLVGLNLARTTVAGGNYSYLPGGAQTMSSVVDNRASSQEWFAVDRWQFAPNWTAVYGAQVVSTSREVASARLKGDYDSINPRAGLIHQLTPSTQLFANVSRIYEAPTLYELEDQSPGTSRGTLLKAMRGTVFEVGTRGKQPLGERHHWHWDLAVYTTQLRNEILSRDDPAAPGTSLSMNAQRTVHAGIEALVGGSFAFGESRQHRIEPLLNVTFNHFRFRNDADYGNNVLPAAPKMALRGEVLYRHGSGFFMGPTFDVVSSRQADFSNTYKVDGYTLWGLRAGWTGKAWEVFAEARHARSQFKAGQLDASGYRTAMQGEIERSVREQEALGLDVLVHGEAERNDMVEYFGEQLDGYALSQFGWVQSYGSRCVKPPILFGDISRPHAMTVEWIAYAQSLTDKPMKGMLTGPVTILNWSFVRDDQPRSASCKQLALAIRQEVLDLEQAGVRVIQIDEAALREGLPLRKSQWQSYLDWAVESFRITANGVRDETQIHTHMCYSEFNDIIGSIAYMDADVITIETSRSNMELLDAFENFAYPNDIGPGVYDIHSPNIPTQAHIEQLMKKAAERIPAERLWVNPDCGLKTRQWPEVIPALMNMVSAAKALREAA